MLHLLILASSVIVSILAQVNPAPADYTLLLVQPVWRHGDRAPVRTYKSDTIQEKDWPQGWGQLTALGMQQHVYLGRLAKEQYIDTHFLSQKYNSHEIYARSTDVNRTIISAISNLMGMYSEANTTAGVDYPSNGFWQGSFVPIAIHTVEDSTDHIGNPDAICDRQDKLWERIKKTPEYLAFLNDTRTKQVVEYATKVSGQKIPVTELWLLVDAIKFERTNFPKYKFPDWYQNYTDFFEVYAKVQDFSNGLNINSSGQNLDLGVEMAKTRGGPLLGAIRNHIQQKITCFRNSSNSHCNWMNRLKYYVFSAHDTTLDALLVTLEAKQKLVPQGYPSVSSSLFTELWYHNKTGTFHLRFLFHRDFSDKLETVTTSVAGCEKTGDFCPVDALEVLAKKYVVDDIDKLCSTSPSSGFIEDQLQWRFGDSFKSALKSLGNLLQL